MIRKCIALLCASFFVLTFTPFSKAQERLENRLIEAVALYNDGDVSAARGILVSLADSDNDAVFYYLGLCDVASGNLQEAMVNLQKAVDLDPHNFWYKYRLASLFSETGKPEKTIELYESLLKDFPKKTDLYYSLVNLYANQNEVDKVLETLSEIESISGKNEMVTLARYDVLMSLDKSEEAYQALVEYNNEYTSPQILAAMGDFKLSEYEDSVALNFYDEALSYDQGCAPALLGRAEALRILRDYPKFLRAVSALMSSPDVPVQPKVQYFNQIITHVDSRFVSTYQEQMDSVINVCVQNHPTDTSVIGMAGTYYYNTSRNNIAAEYFKKNVELLPDSKYARAMYVQFLAYAEDYKNLITESEAAYMKFPEELAFLDMKSIAYYNLQDFEGLIRENERILRAAPSDTAVTLRAYANIGDAYHLLGETRKAYSAYEKALKINPEYVPVLNNYAYYLSEEGRKLKKAYAMSKITIEKEPDNATYLDTFAWILFLQGKPLEAKPFFKHAMLHGGKESETILRHYAEVLYALGEDDLARSYELMLEKLK